MSSKHQAQSRHRTLSRGGRVTFGVIVSLLIAAVLVIVVRQVHLMATAQKTAIRFAFDNLGYPEKLTVQLWLDNATEGYVVDARCTPDHCETAPIMMRRGRHPIELRVIIGDQMSAFTKTTIER